MSSHALVATREERAPKARRSGAAPARSGPLGGEPRVSLLPAEVNDFHKARVVRRQLGVGVVAVLVIAAAGIAGSAYLAMQSQAALDDARLLSQNLAAQQAEFADLRQAQGGIELSLAGQMVGASTEIDWTGYLRSLQATLPAGVTIDTVSIDSASPFVDYVQSTVPLAGSRVATLSFTATSPTIPSIPSWLDGLATLPGFADAVPNSVTSKEDGGYLVNITMHINADAFSGRFAPVEEGQ
jgi:Tfp pilus assembly protein PilN